MVFIITNPFSEVTTKVSKVFLKFLIGIHAVTFEEQNFLTVYLFYCLGLTVTQTVQTNYNPQARKVSACNFWLKYLTSDNFVSCSVLYPNWLLPSKCGKASSSQILFKIRLLDILTCPGAISIYSLVNVAAICNFLILPAESFLRFSSCPSISVAFANSAVIYSALSRSHNPGGKFSTFIWILL